MDDPLRIWQEKLDYLQQQEAIASDAAQKFGLAQQIKEAKAKVAALEATQSSDRLGTIHVDISRIIKYAPAELIGREAETKVLSDAWDQAVRGEKKRPHILTFVALGGEGKTSLVAKWAADLAYQNWPGCDAVFAWSFYSQGTREQTAVSSDTFLAEALTFFGDAAMAGSAQGAFDKGRRLAQIIGERRALLILDGLEPLQYAPTSPTAGELKDQGLAVLLKGLAATNHGLCVVTTRYAIPDLRAYLQTTAPMHELQRLSTAAGVELLRTIGVKTGSQTDFEKLVEDMDGHALTLQIIGQFLVRAFHADIRRRDRISFEKADSKIQGGHAFRAMEAYVRWLENDSEEARREVALLKLLGLFDRPATADCVDSLRKAPAIPGLTEPLLGLAEDDWEFSLTSLRDAKLLTVNREESSGDLIALDAHPLLREYFARRVRQQQPDGWRAAHRRLYDHLCATTPDKPNPTLEDLQPLYQAVAHGCQAGLHEDVFDNVFLARIHRGQEYYAIRKLGCYGQNVAALACFFDRAWDIPNAGLPSPLLISVLVGAAFDLRACGRPTEALEPMRAGVGLAIRNKVWTRAAIHAGNLSELELTLGEVATAVGDAEQSVTYADQSGDFVQRVNQRSKLAGALHEAGRRADAEARFREAEALQVEFQRSYPLLYSVRGFKYCELLLAATERAAWAATLECGDLSLFFSVGELSPREARKLPTGESGDKSPHSKALRAISERAARTLTWVEAARMDILSIALDHLTLGRAAFCAAILESGSGLSPLNQDDQPRRDAAANLDAAVDGLRRAGQLDDLPRGLLSRAWLRFLTGPRAGPESAQADLDEAWEIAERGPMRLFMADIHLYRTRLFHSVKPYPWKSPQEDLAAARKLIEQCGYWRRKEELEDAEAAAKGW